MQQIFYTYFQEPLPASRWQQLLSSLPAPLQKKVCRFRRWQDQHCSLLGKLLLAETLEVFGFSRLLLAELCYSPTQRPYLPEGLVGQLDFNVSHSQQMVVCAASDESRVGIDVECLQRKINLADFHGTLSRLQRQQLQNVDNPTEAFLHLWVQKESAIKADGGGLQITLNQLEVEQGKIVIDDKAWCLQKIELDFEYVCYVASEQEGIPWKINNWSV